MEQYDFNFGTIKCSTHTISQQLEEIRLLLKDKVLQPRLLLTINAHIYNMTYENDNLRNILNSARIVTADGMSIVMASRLLGTKITERCNATDAFRAFLLSKNIQNNFAILIGCTEKEAQIAASNINKISNHCKITKTFSGYLDEVAYEQILETFPEIDFIFLGMGTPKTEQISKIASIICPKAIIWGIGGGTIKIFAGTMKESPVVLRRTGLQWLYRFCCDPITLWRRYLIGNPLFIYRLIKVWLGNCRKFTC